MIKINNGLLNEVSQQAKKSDRKRKNYNFHYGSQDLLQRMLNAMEPETYVRPHKHVNPDKREAFIVLRGTICLIEFDENGEFTDHFVMRAGSGNEGAEITPGSYHTLISMEPGTIIYEIKDGPWDIETDKVFAQWAPEEGSKESKSFILDLQERIKNY